MTDHSERAQVSPVQGGSRGPANRDAGPRTLAEKAALTFPTHYRDGENRGICSWSGSGRADESVPCPNGCTGALEHYSNDGHEMCVDDPMIERAS